MARNIEIKAHIESIDTLAQKAAAIADQGPVEIVQDDTFFRCEAGRLKLRTFSTEEGELIFYRRANLHGPKESFYLCSPTSSPDSLRESLSQAYGQAGRVQKHRTLFVVGRTRVHLDDVKGLGRFLELEVVLNEDESAETGVLEAQALMARLGIDSSQLIEGAYVDLLSEANDGNGNPLIMPNPRPKATSKLLEENARVIVTEWRFVPGAETGWHRHGHDYVVVCLTAGKLLAETSAGNVETDLNFGQAYARPEGVEHNIVNSGEKEFAFVEVEIK